LILAVMARQLTGLCVYSGGNSHSVSSGENEHSKRI
jgi:hypothetical protein